MRSAGHTRGDTYARSDASRAREAWPPVAVVTGRAAARRARRSSAARSVQFNRSCEPGQPSLLPLTPSSISPGTFAFIRLVAAGDGEGHRPAREDTELSQP
jgi:hypothetical protein